MASLPVLACSSQQAKNLFEALLTNSERNSLIQDKQIFTGAKTR